MPGGATAPGSSGIDEAQPRIDAGTNARVCMPSAGTPADRRQFEAAVQALEADVASAGAHLALDAQARLSYSAQARRMSDTLRQQATRGQLSWKQAATQAHEARNAIMELVRGRSTPVGRAWAESLKAEGRSLNDLVARKTVQLFGPKADFGALSTAQQNQVYAEVVTSAGKSNPRVDAQMRRLSRLGKGLLFVSIALSVYQVVQADDKVAAAGREVAVTGAGIAGGVAGGALAGLACGPGAPVCVAIGAFAGGALAAFGVDLFW